MRATDILRVIKPYVLKWAQPDWKPWYPTLTGWSSNPTNTVYRYRLIGKTCELAIRQEVAGTSDAVTATITAPFLSATLSYGVWLAPALVQDNGGSTVWGRGYISQNDTVIHFGLDPGADGGFTASGNKRISTFYIVYEVA